MRAAPKFNWNLNSKFHRKIVQAQVVFPLQAPLGKNQRVNPPSDIKRRDLSFNDAEIPTNAMPDYNGSVEGSLYRRRPRLETLRFRHVLVGEAMNPGRIRTDRSTGIGENHKVRSIGADDRSFNRLDRGIPITLDIKS